MCTVLVRFDPGAEWPVLLAFVRDEDRGRHTAPAGFWWQDQPSAIGGRDERAGGTWLAADVQTSSIALLTDQFDPTATLPDPASSPTRGTLPLEALRGGHSFDLEADAPGDVRSYQPFHLASIFQDRGDWHFERWGWNGTELDHELLVAGVHVIASRATSIPGERARRSSIAERLAAATLPAPDVHGTSAAAWGSWLDVLDGRGVQPDQLDAITVHSVSVRPTFGTVGATLVGIAHDGRIRYDETSSPRLTPDSWSPVSTTSQPAPAGT